MILRVIKIVIFVAFLSRLSICRYRDVNANSYDIENDVNYTVDYPNLLIQQKESEGVSLKKDFELRFLWKSSESEKLKKRLPVMSS